MKKIIILDDSLENVVNCVNELHAMASVSEVFVLLYCENTANVNNRIQGLSEKFSKMPHIETVNIWNYEEKLDEFYCRSDTLFLFDMNLHGDGSTLFNNRINVVYAKNKREKEINIYPKIWFYTTSKPEQKSVLLEQFPECTLQVRCIGKDGVHLDFDDRFLKALTNGPEMKKI